MNHYMSHTEIIEATKPVVEEIEQNIEVVDLNQGFWFGVSNGKETVRISIKDYKKVSTKRALPFGLSLEDAQKLYDDAKMAREQKIQEARKARAAKPKRRYTEQDHYNFQERSGIDRWDI